MMFVVGVTIATLAGLLILNLTVGSVRELRRWGRRGQAETVPGED